MDVDRVYLLHLYYKLRHVVVCELAELDSVFIYSDMLDLEVLVNVFLNDLIVQFEHLAFRKVLVQTHHRCE